MSKFDVGDTVWFFFRDAGTTYPMHLESTKVVSVFPPREGISAAYVLESDDCTYRIPEDRVFATREEARVGAIKFVCEQLNNWQTALKLLEEQHS